MIPILLAAAMAAIPQNPIQAPSPNCAPARITFAADRPGQGAHLLGQEPPANQVMTVARIIDGCAAPLIVKTGIGNTPGR
jgi:hypothetical protein